MENKFKLKKSEFIDWYFDDAHTRIDFGNNAIKELQLYGKFNATIEELLDCCGYVPKRLCEDQSEDTNDELSPLDIELI